MSIAKHVNQGQENVSIVTDALAVKHMFVQ
jgi:hypothetical protein